MELEDYDGRLTRVESDLTECWKALRIHAANDTVADSMRKDLTDIQSQTKSYSEQLSVLKSEVQRHAIAGRIITTKAQLEQSIMEQLILLQQRCEEFFCRLGSVENNQREQQLALDSLRLTDTNNMEVVSKVSADVSEIMSLCREWLPACGAERNIVASDEQLATCKTELNETVTSIGFDNTYRSYQSCKYEAKLKDCPASAQEPPCDDSTELASFKEACEQRLSLLEGSGWGIASLKKSYDQRVSELESSGTEQKNKLTEMQEELENHRALLIELGELAQRELDSGPMLGQTTESPDFPSPDSATVKSSTLIKGIVEIMKTQDQDSSINRRHHQLEATIAKNFEETRFAMSTIEEELQSLKRYKDSNLATQDLFASTSGDQFALARLEAAISSLRQDVDVALEDQRSKLESTQNELQSIQARHQEMFSTLDLRHNKDDALDGDKNCMGRTLEELQLFSAQHGDTFDFNPDRADVQNDSLSDNGSDPERYGIGKSSRGSILLEHGEIDDDDDRISVATLDLTSSTRYTDNRYAIKRLSQDAHVDDESRASEPENRKSKTRSSLMAD